MHDDDDLLPDVVGFWPTAARGHDIIGVRAKSRLFALTPMMSWPRAAVGQKPTTSGSRSSSSCILYRPAEKRGNPNLRGRESRI